MFSKILVIDNEHSTANSLTKILKANSYHFHQSDDGKEALSYLKEHACELAIIDAELEDMSVHDFIAKAKNTTPNLLIIIISSNQKVDIAVEFMRQGADHYLEKPISYDTLLSSFNQLKAPPKKKATPPSKSQDIIAESLVMKKILEEVQRIAQSHANVFITGESGTGKEVIAHALHYYSLRADHPYIRVNCAAIPETLIESEFFGHEKGAFTGATGQRAGRFELAHQGTLLLDEVTEIPLSLQAKLLRVVQEQEFERVGGVKSINVNVRIISTSNRDIPNALNDNTFRNDLFYRLNVVPIHLPPLRERQDDILPLAEHFLQKLCHSNQKELKKLSKESQNTLLAYSWPGNIRELANTIERAIVMYDEKVIEPHHLHITNQGDGTITLAEIEKRHIIEMLQNHQNDRAKVAKMLGITKRKLEGKIDEHEIR